MNGGKFIFFGMVKKSDFERPYMAFFVRNNLVLPNYGWINPPTVLDLSDMDSISDYFRNNPDHLGGDIERIIRYYAAQ